MATNNLATISLLADMGNGEVQNPVTDLPLVNGQDATITTPGRIVHWDAEWHWDATYGQYDHQALGGHLVALGLSEAHQIWEEYTYPILNWADQQNAIAGFVHMQYLDNGIPQSLNCCIPIEYPVEVALGTADFIAEDVTGSDSAIQAYYRLLNNGFRPGFAAGTDYPCGVSDLGSLLTYVQVAGGQMTYRNWIEGIKQGRTVVSRNGHNEFLNLTVNNTATPGDEINLTSSGSVPVTVEWTAKQNLTGTIELVQNGVVVASRQESVTSSTPASLTATIDFTKSGWLAARRMGSNGHQLQTGAVFVTVNNQPVRVSATDAEFYVQWMDNLLTKTSPAGEWSSYFVNSRAAAQARYQVAKAIYQQIASEAGATPQPLVISTTSLPDGILGLAYSATLTASGGITPYSWSIASGLPPGLMLNSGAITGTPTTAGSYSFTVQVSDATIPNAQIATQALSINAQSVAAAGIAVDTTVFRDVRGTATTPAFSTAGANRLLLAFVASDGPPTGLQTATVSGGGLTWMLVRRTNTRAGTSEVWRAFATSALSNVTVQSVQAQANYDQSLTVVALMGANGVGANSGASAASGAPSVALTTTVPNAWVFGVGNDWDNSVGRTLGADQTMVHQWVDTGVGDTFWVQRLNNAIAAAGTAVTINDTAPITDRWNLTAVEVVPGTPAQPPTLSFIAVTPTNPTINVGATQQFTATGTYSDGSMQNINSQVTWAASSATPAVATITTAGLATGLSIGASSISSTFSGITGSTVMTVVAPPLAITPASLPGGTVGQAYSLSLAASGGVPPYSWSISSGSLPVGLSLNADTGAITGTPTSAGLSSFTVQVSDASSPTTQIASKTLSITVANAVTNTGFLAPTTNAAVTSNAGDNNGFQTNPANAHADDGLFAVDMNSGTNTNTSCTNNGKDKHIYRDYGFGLSSGATIKGIDIRLDAKVENSSNAPKMCVQLSWNGGVTWTVAKSTATLSTAEATYILGGSADTWGRTWASDDFSNTNFRLRIINVASSTARDFSLDWVTVKVTYQ
jgi:hypothetical protein